MTKTACQRFKQVEIARLVLYAVLGFWLSADTVSGAEIEIKVMSFNIRYSYGKPQESAAENDWYDAKYPRRERVIRVIRDYLPDLLGVQEARDLQINDLRTALPEYEFYGIGRDDGKTEGEFSGIYFRSDRFTKKDAGSFWLSDTPEKPGTTFYKAENAVPRIASWVRLTEKEFGREIFVLNMHWDHIDVPARRQSAALARERVAALAEGLPTIVMGDLNAGERSAEYRELCHGNNETGRKLVDSYREIYAERKLDESSFGGWEGRTEGGRIDFILHTDEFTPTAAAIDRTNYEGRWPSDHYPVTATLRLKGSKRNE
jgi:endonuclease/exonuclease/phosphatase family metal-dependent hydrolase